MKYFVTAIGTDSGKTVVSAILVEALGGDYWKPIQAGFPSDSEVVKKLVSNPGSKIHPEAYFLNTPASPHASAKLDGITISLSDIKAPETERPLIIEGAGGAMVPLNDQDLVVDLITYLGAVPILVADLYLGSINHTLLTAELLKCRKLEPLGIIFNGEPNPESEEIILKHTGYQVLLRIQEEPVINQQMIRDYANKLNKNLNDGKTH